MEVLHNKKYRPLYLTMVSNIWLVHLFPTEVGARGYCFATVKSFLMRLSFSTSRIKVIKFNILKILLPDLVVSEL